MMGEAVGPRLQFAIRQPGVVMHDSDRLRRPDRLRLEEFVHACIARIVPFGLVPPDNQPMALRLAEQRQPIDRPLLIGRHRLEQPAQIAG